MLTQKQLAEQLGVSQQAVSFALNGGGTLKQATREYIIEGAQKAGYRVNSASRMFREGKTNSIAFVVSGNFHALPGIMLSGMRPILRENDIHLTLFGAEDEDFQDPKNPPRLVREMSADGFLVLFDGRGNTLSEQIANYRIPSVWINQKQDRNAVYPDDYGIALRAVRELSQQIKGHILYIGPEVNADSHYSAKDRRDGFLKGVEGTGRTGEVVHVLGNAQSPDEKSELVRSILTRKRKRPKIVICYGIEEAESFHVHAALLGIRIPEDLIVCGFSMHRAGVGHYHITRIFIPIHFVGVEAVRMLLKRIQNPGKDFPSVAVDDLILHQEEGPKSFYL